jgi:hypothetical protein
MSIRDIEDDEARDRELAKKVGDEIDDTIEALRRSRNQNRLDEVTQLSSSLESLCASYQDLREIDGS